LEALTWGAIVAAGAALRLASLERLPLTLAESERALEAWRVTEGDTPDGWRGDLVASATPYLFRLFGESEPAARLLPAFAGVALVGLLWFARPYIGRVGALAAAVLAAFSPLFIVASRSGTAYSAGAFLGAAMALLLLAYLREPRAGLMLPLAVCVALAPLTDAVAVSALLAVVLFLVIEGGFLSGGEVTQAGRAFRRSPVQWISALLVLAAGLQLGMTHFGTSLGSPWLPGVELWTEMFERPGDGREPEYYLALLLGYDWPILLAGAAGFAALVWRLGSGVRALSLARRFLLVWTFVSALTLALTAQREAGQVLMLMLPMVLLAGTLTEEMVSSIEWGMVARWWPAGAAALATAGFAALLMTEWSSGSARPTERIMLIAAVGGFVALVMIPGLLVRQGMTVVAGVGVVVAAAFMAHSSLAVAFGDGAEFAVDQRLLARTEQLRVTLDVLAEQRDGPIVVDAALIDELGWALRNSPVVFRDSAEGSGALVLPAGPAPPGFVPLGEAWRVAEGWYPEGLLRPRSMWRWLVFREPYYGREGVDVRIYVPTV